VGLNESESHKQGLQFKVKKEMTSNWYSSRRIAEKYSGFKVLAEEGTDRILGAHLLGIEAEEVINLFGVAMRSGMRATGLKEMVYAYPTRGSDVPYMP
jgi:glutathione reductase (NADPH)